MNPPVSAEATAGNREGRPQRKGDFPPRRLRSPLAKPEEFKRTTQESPRSCGIAGAVLLMLTALLLAGCGYRFAAEVETLSPSFRTVFVDGFTNRTSEPYADTLFRSAFIARFVQEGRLRLAGSRAEADLICRGTVRSLQAAPLAHKPTNLAAEDRITVTLQISLEERGSGRVIWEESSFVATGDYPVTTVGVTELSRRNALAKLAGDSAERAHALMMSGF